MEQTRGWLGRTLLACALTACLSFAVLMAMPAAEAAKRPCSAGLVALTFDDGPSPTQTPRLVRLLRDRNVPATFFMVGSRVESASRVARQVARAGFEIANHSWSHAMLTRLPDREIRRQLRGTSRQFRARQLHAGRLMRPPYGAIDRRVRAVVRSRGLVPVLWDVDSRDWAGGNARQIADRILGQLRRHRSNIVLQHDGVTNSPASVKAVPLVIREARRRGYCFTRLGADGRMLPRSPRHRSRVMNQAAPVAPRVAPRVQPIAVTTVRIGTFDPWFELRS